MVHADTHPHQPPDRSALDSLLRSAVERLAAGGLVAFPTETVYGLGADATNAAAVQRVFAIKGRPANNPLIVHVGDVAMARQVTASWPGEAQQLAQAFWPGPLTFVLPKHPSLPTGVTGGGPGVAVRCPDHPLTLELIAMFGRPLVGPSANPSSRVSPTAAAHVRSYFSEQEVLVLDGGACSAGIESTVIEVRPSLPPRLLRPGVVTLQEIAAALGIPVATIADAAQVQPKQRTTAHAHPLASPGLLERHYAPTMPASLADAAHISVALQRSAPTVAALLLTPPAAAPAPGHLIIPMLSDARGYAANLYAALMRADAAGVDQILVEHPGPDRADGVWQAVLDRLTRATNPNADEQG